MRAMEAVHVRGDTASCRADLKRGGRDTVDFGIRAQSQGQTQTGRHPARATQRMQGWRRKPEEIKVEIRFTFFCQQWQPIEKECSVRLSARVCGDGNHTETQRLLKVCLKHREMVYSQ